MEISGTYIGDLPVYTLVRSNCRPDFTMKQNKHVYCTDTSSTFIQLHNRIPTKLLIKVLDGVNV